MPSERLHPAARLVLFSLLFACAALSSSASPAVEPTDEIGTYTGSFHLHGHERGCVIDNTGTLVGALTLRGNVLAGTVMAGGRLGLGGTDSCALVPKPDLPSQFVAQIDGTSASGTLEVPQDGRPSIYAPFTGTFVDGTLQGHAGDSNDYLDFRMTRDSTATAPSVMSFSAAPSAVLPGDAAILSWTTVDATAVWIDGIGSREVSGSIKVRPLVTTVYMLTATGPGGVARAAVTVTVTPPEPRAAVVVSSFPRGMLMLQGTESLPTDSFTLTNVGSLRTDIALTQTGAFFTQSPTSFSLEPGASQVVTIAATGAPAGANIGASLISGNGVPAGASLKIYLLVTTAPAAPVVVTSAVRRSDFSAPAGENPTGTIAFTNRSRESITGVVVADVPWIIIANPILTIGAGEVGKVNVTFDRTLRPDADSLLGGLIGSVTYRYVNSSTATTGTTAKTGTMGTTVVSSVSVSLADVVKPGVSPGTPPPLGPDEEAFFVPAISSRPGSIGDVTLSNRSGAAISDLRMYFSAAGASTGQMTSVAQFRPDAAIAFPGVINNVFGAVSQLGTLQLRSSDMSGISVGRMQITDSSAGTFVTALPLFSSARGISAGASIYLPGVEKSATLSTNLYVQELTGNGVTVDVDFLDPAGTVIGSRTADAIGPFGLLELQNVVPAGAVLARVKNASSGASRINAYALVLDSLTGDAFSVVSIGPAEDVFIAPAVGSSGGELVLNMANSSDATISVTATTMSGSDRRRAANRSGEVQLNGAPSIVSIPPLATVQLRVDGAGYVRLTGSDALRVTGRYSATGSGGTFGSGIAVIPPSRALYAGASRRFAAVEDASSSTIAAARPLTYRTNLLLAETEGREITVRLTLRFMFSAGLTAAGVGVVPREVVVPGRGAIRMNDLAKAMIGPEREKYGDIRGATLDVEIIGGDGALLPFLEMIDNATGEVTVRND